MRKVHSPTSRAQDERRNVLQQNDFAYGVYNDVPSNEIPTRGVHRLINYTNKSSYLESRTGSRLWGDNITDPLSPTPATRVPVAVSGLTAFVERLDPYTLTYTIPEAGINTEIPAIVNLTGWYVSRDDNGVLKNDKITSAQVLNNSYILKVATGEDITDVDGSVTVDISGPVYGLFYSRFHSRVIMHTGCSLYVSTNQYMTEWSKASFVGTPVDGYTNCCPVYDSRSTIREFDGTVVIMNRNGVFHLDCLTLPSVFFKTNSDVPTDRLVGIAEDANAPEYPNSDTLKYGRKRVYSYSRLSGDGVRDRMTSGIKVEWESGGTTIATGERDYAVEWRLDEATMISATDNIVGLKIDGNSKVHATHFSVYATRNIEEEFGIAAVGNNTEELIWEMDVPIGNVWRIAVASEDSPGVFTFTSLVIDSMWLGTTVNINGANYTITDLTATGGELTGNAGSLSVASYTMSVGCDGVDTGVVTNSTTLTVGDTSVYSEGDKLYISSDRVRFIDSVVDATTIILNDNIDNGVLYWGTSFSEITMSTINSDVLDYELTVRAESMPMLSRFWAPVESSDLGDVLPGFIMFGRYGEQGIQYSQLTAGFEYLLGQYNPLYQFDKFDDSVRDITGFDGAFVVKCNTSTKSLNSTSWTSSGNPDVGRFVFVLSTVTTISDQIGVVGPWASVKIDGDTAEWVITSRMELRKFDGREYGVNVMSRRLMNRLRNMNTEFSLGYHPYFGLVVWGVQ